MNNSDYNLLLQKAKEIANKNICCSYSNFTVGAALIDSAGNIYQGFNIENHGIQSICAERTAFCSALTAGSKNFEGIAIVGKRIDAENFSKTLPCGYCRQFMSEYGGPDLLIITEDEANHKIYTYTLKELLPEAFQEF